MSVVVLVSPDETATHLARWGLAFARATSARHLTVIVPEGADIEESLLDFGDVQLETKPLVAAGLKGMQDEVLLMIQEAKASLFLSSKPRKNEGMEPQRDLARWLFTHAPCDTILLRFGESFEPSSEEGWRILVPSSGGPNSKKALKLAWKVVESSGGVLMPLMVEPDADEVAEEVGEHILDSVLKRAGVDPKAENVRPLVVLSDSVEKGIHIASESADADMLLVGASNFGTLRRVLFGTIPDRLLRGDDPMAVAVIRRAAPMGERVKRRIERWLSLRVPQLERPDRVALFETMQRNARWSFDFMTLICLSTAIASLGLIANSAAVVIGAMLVAPLMMPLLGSGLALVQGNGLLLKECVKAIVFGFLSALGIGYLIGLMTPIGGLTSELASRGGPTLLDMGVAFLSGVAASYCIARPNLSSALAGVAIAAALVPPIATVGISLSLEEGGNALGAATLFATNVAAIILGAAINFYAAGIRGQKNRGRAILWARRMLFGLILSLALLAVPLGSLLISQLSDRPVIERRIEKVPVGCAEEIVKVLDEEQQEYRLHELLAFRRVNGALVIEIEVMGNSTPTKALATKIAKQVEPFFEERPVVRVFAPPFVES